MLTHSGTFYPNLFQIFKFYNEFGIHYSSSARVGKSQKMQKFVNNLILVGLVQCTLIHGYIKSPNMNYWFWLQSVPCNAKIGFH